MPRSRPAQAAQLTRQTNEIDHRQAQPVFDPVTADDSARIGAADPASVAQADFSPNTVHSLQSC